MRLLSEIERNLLTTLLGLVILGIPVAAFLALVNYVAPLDKDILLLQHGKEIDPTKINSLLRIELREVSSQHWKDKLSHHRSTHDYWGWVKTFFRTPLRNELPTSTTSPNGAAMPFAKLPLLPATYAGFDPENNLPYFTIATSADLNLYGALHELDIRQEIIIPGRWNSHAPTSSDLLNTAERPEDFFPSSASLDMPGSDPILAWTHRPGLNTLIYPTHHWEYIAAAAIATVSSTENPALTKTDALEFIEHITHRHVFVHEGRNLTTAEIYEWTRGELYGLHEIMATHEHIPYPTAINRCLAQQKKGVSINA